MVHSNTVCVRARFDGMSMCRGPQTRSSLMKPEPHKTIVLEVKNCLGRLLIHFRVGESQCGQIMTCDIQCCHDLNAQ